MRKFNLTIPLRQIAKNTCRLFKLAWKMDKKTTALYYLTASIGALVPLASSYILKLLIDYLQLAQKSLLPTVPIIIVVVIAARYFVTLLDGAVYWGINQSYLDYIFRYKLQNDIALRFHKKIQKLDIAYFEKPDV